jgi:hypothetical protein
VRSLNLGILPPLLSATDQIQGEITTEKVKPIVQTLLNNGEAALKSLTIPFNINGGTVRAQNVAAATELASVNGGVEINLPAERLKGSLDVDFNPGGEALAGANPGLRLDFDGALQTPRATLDVTDVTGFLSLRAFERERRRVERLQANVLEKQRLRREVALYKFTAAQREIERQRQAEIERQREAEERRLRTLAQQAVERQRADAEAKAKAEAEAARARAEAGRQATPLPPGAGNLNFNSLPGIAQ